jgi:alpha-galactosidase
MGWNSWNTFGPNINEEVVRETAEAFLRTGLSDAGYRYVVIDDHWEADERADGCLRWDAEKFPRGIPDLASFVHGLGLQFGIYSCSGTHTCGGKPASFGYEETDALTFAQWGVDYLKYDHCFFPPGAVGRTAYQRMGQALRSSGRPILYSLCNWGRDDVWTWGAAVGGHLWRTTGDIADTWDSIVRIGFERQRELYPYAGPNHWNDPDMLVVGMHNRGHVARGGCTDAEYRSHFSLWCLLAAPLMIGCDVRELSDTACRILLQRELIAVNQDPLGVQGAPLGRHRDVEVWSKPLADGSLAVGFFNLSDRTRAKSPVAWEQLGLHDRRPCRVRDLWGGEDLGEFTRCFNTGTIEPHDCQIIRLTPRVCG